MSSAPARGAAGSLLPALGREPDLLGRQFPQDLYPLLTWQLKEGVQPLGARRDLKSSADGLEDVNCPDSALHFRHSTPHWFTYNQCRGGLPKSCRRPGGRHGSVIRAPYTPAVDLPSEGTAPSGSAELDKIRRELIAAAAPPELVAFVDAMNEHRPAIPVASVAYAVSIVRPFLEGPVSGYKMARLLDTSKSPAEAKDNPATAPALEIVKALGVEAFGYDQAIPAQDQRGFDFEEEPL